MIRPPVFAAAPKAFDVDAGRRGEEPFSIVSCPAASWVCLLVCDWLERKRLAPFYRRPDTEEAADSDESVTSCQSGPVRCSGSGAPITRSWKG